MDGTVEKKEEALVEAVKEVKIKDDVKEDCGGKKNDEETGKKAAEPGEFHWRIDPHSINTLFLAHPDKALLKSQFVLFSKFGDKASDGETIKLSQSDKWFKQVITDHNYFYGLKTKAEKYIYKRKASAQW